MPQALHQLPPPLRRLVSGAFEVSGGQQQRWRACKRWEYGLHRDGQQLPAHVGAWEVGGRRPAHPPQLPPVQQYGDVVGPARVLLWEDDVVGTTQDLLRSKQLQGRRHNLLQQHCCRAMSPHLQGHLQSPQHQALRPAHLVEAVDVPSQNAELLRRRCSQQLPDRCRSFRRHMHRGWLRSMLLRGWCGRRLVVSILEQGRDGSVQHVGGQTAQQRGH
mmetsp:Transcript_72815/g.236551  ORF Transcript_72815/g.236551 Transcript_72815/m.236551 type:complete len:217 (+) Transcript_72815:661-1311(+)